MQGFLLPPCSRVMLTVDERVRSGRSIRMQALSRLPVMKLTLLALAAALLVLAAVARFQATGLSLFSPEPVEAQSAVEDEAPPLPQADESPPVRYGAVPVTVPPWLLSHRMARVSARPEVLCGALAVFGLVKSGLQPVALRNGAWECTPLLANVEPVPDEGPATSLFTLVRGRGSLDPPMIRIKINELDPATRDRARETVLTALRSAVRNYGVELPAAHVAAIRTMERTDSVVDGLRLRIVPEMGDPRRLNLLLEFVPEEDVASDASEAD